MLCPESPCGHGIGTRAYIIYGSHNEQSKSVLLSILQASKMAALKTLLLCAITAAALPSPIGLSGRETQPLSSSNAPWDAGATTQFPIHPSCNATQRRQIEQGLNETVELAAHAKAHILRWGNESDIYQKYFGNRPSVEPIGAFELIVKGNRDVLFRCDNPDGNCQIEGEFYHKTPSRFFFIQSIDISRLCRTLARGEWNG